MTNPTVSPPNPDWAIEHARASLRVGLKVPEIEHRLIARGLTAGAATSAVTKALEDRIREEVEPKERERRRSRMHRIMSGALVGAYIIIITLRTGEIESVIYALGAFLLPLACIWFGDELGSATGPTGILRPYITFPTPGIVVRLGGWTILLLPCIVGPIVWVFRRLLG
jgi:hypothetical protein